MKAIKAFPVPAAITQSEATLAGCFASQPRRSQLLITAEQLAAPLLVRYGSDLAVLGVFGAFMALSAWFFVTALRRHWRLEANGRLIEGMLLEIGLKKHPLGPGASIMCMFSTSSKTLRASRSPAISRSAERICVTSNYHPPAPLFRCCTPMMLLSGYSRGKTSQIQMSVIGACTTRATRFRLLVRVLEVHHVQVEWVDRAIAEGETDIIVRMDSSHLAYASISSQCMCTGRSNAA